LPSKAPLLCLIHLVRMVHGNMLLDITCLIRSRRFGAFAPTLLRVLTEAHSYKARLAQLAMVRPCRKGNLGHECRCHPMDVRTSRRITLVNRRSCLL